MYIKIDDDFRLFKQLHCSYAKQMPPHFTTTFKQQHMIRVVNQSAQYKGNMKVAPTYFSQGPPL